MELKGMMTRYEGKDFLGIGAPRLGLIYMEAD